MLKKKNSKSDDNHAYVTHEYEDILFLVNKK